ncbi:hypothetical protein IWGMT90018_32240 [Mycobacterium kiyosense]|nr:hypothetical protein IWGMT90018_32240 [Mycobacterium kiyosense]
MFEVAGQPGDALDVEVVGGLVEGDHVPFADEQLRQLDPSTLSTAERGNPCSPIDVGDQPTHHVADAGVAGPLMFGLVANQLGADRAIGAQGVGLAEGTHPQPGSKCHPTGVGRQSAGEQAEQAGLAVAVAPHDADTGAVVHPQGDRLEYHLVRIRQVDRLGPE